MKTGRRWLWLLLAFLLPLSLFSCDEQTDAATTTFTESASVENVSIPILVEQGFEARKNAEQGVYSYRVEQNTVSDGVRTGRCFDTRVVFDTVEGAFSLEITSRGTYGDNEAFASSTCYRDGLLIEAEQDFVSGEEISRKETASSDADGRAYLADYVTWWDYCADDVVRVETLEEGHRYRLHFGQRVEDDFREVYENAGGALTVFEAYLEVTLQGDMPQAYTYYLHTGGWTGKIAEQDNVYILTYRFTE